MTERETALPEPSRAMELARQEAVAAYAIATDPGGNAALAVPHLVSGWRWFYVAVEREPPPASVSEIASWVRKRSTQAVGSARADAAGGFLEKHGSTATTFEPPASIEETTLLEHLAVLRERVDAERRRRGELPPARTLRVLWARRVATWVGIGFAAFLVALRPWQWEGIGSWRGAYYPGYELRGDPDVRREQDVDFDWGVLPPTDSIQSDRFGARFDTCMVVEEEAEVTFQLIADDGAKFYIDDEVVIDIWDPLGEVPTAKGITVMVREGVHHLRVDYHDEDEEAQVHLVATFDLDVPPEPIPARMLEYPGEDFDEEDPCAGVE